MKYQNETFSEVRTYQLLVEAVDDLLSKLDVLLSHLKLQSGLVQESQLLLLL